MAYRNGNYSAFYVDEPFSETNLGAHATRDFVYYNLLRTWKGKDSTFPFLDSHSKTYNVRDNSNWESTLKPRIRERLRNSTNLILFLSSITRNSRALREEVDYGINDMGLPVIVVYPECASESDIIDCKMKRFKKSIKDYWDRLPKFRDSMESVPTLHVPMKQSSITQALQNRKLKVQTKSEPGKLFYPC